MRALEPSPRGGDNLPLVPMGEAIRLIQQQAQIFEVPDMGTLYRWILEHRVSRTDLFSVHGMRWQAVGDRPDLERFFAAAEALKGRPQPSVSRWDNMDVVPMEETPSTVEHLLHAPRSALPEPKSQSGIVPLEPIDRASNSGVRVERAPAGGMFGPPPTPQRRSPIEEQAVEIEMDSASEHGVTPQPSGQFGLSVATGAAAPAKPPESRRVDIFADMPDFGDTSSSFAMDPASSAGEMDDNRQEMSFDLGFPDSGDSNSVVAADSASSAGIEMEDTHDASFSGERMFDTPVSTDSLQPVGKARPPVIQLRPPRRRRDEQDEETMEAPSSADMKTAADPRGEAARTPPAPDPVFGPTPRVSITPNTPSPRRELEEEPEEPPRTTPIWVWGVAMGSVLFITVLAVFAWSTLNPKPEPTKVDKVEVKTPDLPTEAVPPAPTEPTPVAPSPVAPTPEPSAPKPAPEIPKPKPVTPVSSPTNPPPPPKPTTPPPTSGKALVKQGWAMVEKDPAKARDLFGRAVQANPGNAEAVYGRGYAAAKMGDSAGARSDLCQAQRLNTDPELGAEIQAGLRRVGGACN